MKKHHVFFKEKNQRIQGKRTNGGQRDEAEISRVEERPFFPLAEEVGAAEYVADN